MKVIKRVLIGILVIIILIPISYFVVHAIIGPMVNNARASKVEKSLSKIQLPPEIKFIESYSYCGNTSGTGNHVEIWAEILIYSELSEEELNSFYEAEIMRHIDYEPHLYTVPEDLDKFYPEPRTFIFFSHFNGKSVGKNYYIIGGYFDATTQIDIRGY